MSRLNPLLSDRENALDGVIRSSVALDPVAQAEKLVAAYAACGPDAGTFVAFLVGELVVTRVRLAAADPRTLWGLAS